jgi:hypothetical protein
MYWTRGALHGQVAHDALGAFAGAAAWLRQILGTAVQVWFAVAVAFTIGRALRVLCWIRHVDSWNAITPVCDTFAHSQVAR